MSKIKVTKESMLLSFIKSGHDQSRRWSECRKFYFDNCYTNSIYVRGLRGAGRAMDYALYRLESKGLTKNVSRGVHRAV